MVNNILAQRHVQGVSASQENARYSTLPSHLCLLGGEKQICTLRDTKTICLHSDTHWHWGHAAAGAFEFGF